jgi:hexosaminidase
MLDVARYFMPKNDVLKFIDTMATLKLNTLHWHLTDDQGWRIEIKKYPKLTTIGAWRDGTVVGHALQYRDGKKPLETDGVRHGGFYTQDDVREIVAYAAARHITVVPEIDMPGHMQAAIAAYPELGCLDESVAVRTTWGPGNVILNPEETTVQFCKDVLAEVMELFPDEFIHIGGDEAIKDQWESSARIQHLREERGLKDMHEMQSWFIKQINDFLVANHRRLVGWDEIAEGGLAKNAVVMWWRATDFDDSGTQIAIDAAAAGHDIIVASNRTLYFDYYQDKNESAEPLAIGEFLPLETVYSFDPVFDGLDEKTASHVLGVQGLLWTEYMPCLSHVEYMAFPRACALAELAWVPSEQKNYATSLERMKVQEKRFDASDVNHRKISHDAAETEVHEGALMASESCFENDELVGIDRRMSLLQNPSG